MISCQSLQIHLVHRSSLHLSSISLLNVGLRHLPSPVSLKLLSSQTHSLLVPLSAKLYSFYDALVWNSSFLNTLDRSSCYHKACGPIDVTSVNSLHTWPLRRSFPAFDDLCLAEQWIGYVCSITLSWRCLESSARPALTHWLKSFDWSFGSLWSFCRFRFRLEPQELTACAS